MIPKIIHYCWFGKTKKSKKIKKCIRSWKKIFPDFEIVCWNESNCNIKENAFVDEAYSLKKYAFVADYFRAKILYEVGGLYLDTDMLLLKRFDFAFENSAFCGLANPGIISMGLLGFSPGNNLIKEHLDSYHNSHFISDKGKMILVTNVTKFSDMLKAKGLTLEDKKMIVDDIAIYPTDYFYPTDFDGLRNNYSENTCAVHLHLASWLPWYKRIKIKIERKIRSSRLYQKRYKKGNN